MYIYIYIYIQNVSRLEKIHQLSEQLSEREFDPFVAHFSSNFIIKKIIKREEIIFLYIFREELR